MGQLSLAQPAALVLAAVAAAAALTPFLVYACIQRQGFWYAGRMADLLVPYIPYGLPVLGLLWARLARLDRKE